jgi:hypothetical protein
MSHRGHRADLEQGLPIPLNQFLEDNAPRPIIESSEDIDHDQMIGKWEVTDQAGEIRDSNGP